MKVTTSFGTVKIVMLKGEKGDKFEFEDYTPEELESLRGEKGDPFTYEDFTEEQLTDLRSAVASAYYRKIDATYYTIGDNTETIAIPIEGYNETDMLFIDIEGLALTEGVDYTIDGSNIVLANPITHNYTAVNFRALRAFAITTEDYDSLIGDLTSDLDSYVDEWLTEHPEAATTVQDGSITNDKLAQSGGILSEVVDIRTGADGVAYNAAGDAVRGQVGNLSSEIDDVRRGLYDFGFSISSDDIEQGGWAYTTKINTMTRLRLNRLLRVSAGQILRINNNATQYNVLIYANIGDSSPIQTTGWKSVGVKLEIIEDGYMVIVFKKTDDGNISPSEFSADITISSEKIDSINALLDKNASDVLPVEWEIGGYNSNGKTPNEKRIRTYDTFKVNPGDTFGIYLPNDYYRIAFLIWVDGVYASNYSDIMPISTASKEFTVSEDATGALTMAIMLVTNPEATITDDMLTAISEDAVLIKFDNDHRRKVYRFGGTGNDWCFVRLPENYSENRPKPYPFVICNHGNGWSMDGTEEKANWTKRTMYVPTTDNDYIANPTQYNGTDDEMLWYSNPTIEALLTAGYIVCGCQNYADNLYGNENCRKACADFYEHMQKNYNVEKRCCMIGASNGAQTSINAAYLLDERVKAMILQYPLTCLINQYENYNPHQGAIRAAYGITDVAIGEDDLIKATATHDFMHTDMAGGVKVGYFPPTKLYYSPDDAVTVATYNALAMYQSLYDSNKIVEKVECSGGHGDYSHFDPISYVEFFNRY